MPVKHNLLYGRSVALLAVVAMMVALAGWGQVATAQEDRDKYGGAVTYAENESVSVFNPYQRKEARGTSDRLYTLIYDGLVSYDFEREASVPALAADWSPKGSVASETITFQLRDGVTWHDGEPLTVEDVVFTYNYILDAGSSDEARAHMASLVDSVSANASNGTVTFHLRQRTPKPASRFAGLWIIPEHRFTDQMIPKSGQPSLKDEPLGTGPYRFEERKLNGNIRLSAFENYWGDRAYIGETRMKLVLDPTTMALQAQGESIQLLVETPPDQISRLEQTGDFKLESYQSLSFDAFAYNMTHPVLGKKRVRRAFTHAVDREGLLSNWYAGKGAVIGGPFVPGHPFYNPDVEPVEHDPATARQLLEEAGYRDRDGDGIRETEDGTDLAFRLVTLVKEAATSTVNQNVAESYASQLREIGVQVNVVNEVRAKYQETLFEERAFDIAWIRWEFDPIYDIASLFTTRTDRPGGDNIVSYSSQKVDNLIQEFKQADDPERRRQLMYRVQEIIAEDMPYTFLYTVANYASIQYAIVSTRIDPYYFFSYYDGWYISPDFR